MDEHVDKKPKIVGDSNSAVEDTRCQYILVKKNRQCGMLKSKQSNEYCTEHLLHMKKINQSELRNNNSKKGIRIPCPLDPNHTVWEIDLKKHLNKCTKGKSQKINNEKPWFCKDINCGVDEDTVGKCDSPIQEIIKKIVPVLQSLQSLQNKMEIPTPELEILKDDHVEHHRVEQLFGNQSKHAVQQSSLIQHIKRGMSSLENKENTEKTVIAEFGCGRAELSRYLNLSLSLDQTLESHKKTTDYDFLLIDRGNNRLKFDSKFKDDVGKLPAPKVAREKCDIKDINLNELITTDFPHESSSSSTPDSSTSQYKNIVSISKHLCGVATDLTLRCLEKSADARKDTTYKIVIAMCCRHVCNYRDYVNPSYIKEILDSYYNTMDNTLNDPLKVEEFFLGLTKICSWATCGRRPDVDINTEDTHFTKISIVEREKLGIMARRIIDQGRLNYLLSKTTLCKEHTTNNKPRLIQYCNMETSLENVALIL